MSCNKRRQSPRELFPGVTTLTLPQDAIRHDVDDSRVTYDDVISAINCSEETEKIDDNKVNVNGGAIALGHPIGCTGVRITTTLLHEMKKRNVKRGLASLCISGGMGISLLLERE